MTARLPDSRKSDLSLNEVRDDSQSILIGEYEESEPIALEEEDDIFIQDVVNGPKKRISLRYNRDGLATVRAKQFAGIIELPSGRSIQIQPKTAGGNLIPLLLYAYNIPIQSMDEEASLRGGAFFLDIITLMFISELRRVLRVGLRREYVGVQRRERHLVGRWNFSRQLQRGPLPNTSFECDYEELSPDTLLNRTIRYAAHILTWITQDNNLRANVSRLEQELASHAQLMVIAPQNLQRLELTRLTMYYRRIIELSKLIIQGIHVENFRAGGRQGLAVLVNMNEVWEQVLSRAFQDAFGSRECVQIEEQARNSSLLRGTPEVNLKPDILIKHRDCPVLVVDAKWKTPRRARSSDLVQMAAYQASYDAPGWLVYPESDDLEPTEYDVRNSHLLRVVALPLREKVSSSEDLGDLLVHALRQEMKEVEGRNPLNSKISTGEEGGLSGNLQSPKSR